MAFGNQKSQEFLQVNTAQEKPQPWTGQFRSPEEARNYYQKNYGEHFDTLKDETANDNDDEGLSIENALTVKSKAAFIENNDSEEKNSKKNKLDSASRLFARGHNYPGEDQDQAV